jgi:hypothetical protein
LTLILLDDDRPTIPLLQKCKKKYSQDGINGIRDTVDLTVGIAKEKMLDHTTRRLTRLNAKNVFTRQWDVLILLDCARVDMMQEIMDEYDFINDVNQLKSVSGHSRGWMEYTFVDKFYDEIQNTLYVNANTASDRVLDSNDFLHLEEVWRDGWDDEHKTILAETVTDRAISLYRRFNPEHTIIHYMQPHSPFVPFPKVSSGQVTGPGIENGYRKSLEELAEEYSREDLWEFHIENLRYVLDSVQTVLSNIEAERVIISADHG